MRRITKYQCFVCGRFFCEEPRTVASGSFICPDCFNIVHSTCINEEASSVECLYGGLWHVFCMIRETRKITMSGIEFEHLCFDILLLDGFSNVRLTKASGDNGVDIRCEKNGEKYVVQCKCTAGTCSNHAVQEVLSGKRVYDADRCIVMSNTRFSRQAQTLANTNGVELYSFGRIRYILERHFALNEDFIEAA